MAAAEVRAQSSALKAWKQCSDRQTLLSPPSSSAALPFARIKAIESRGRVQGIYCLAVPTASEHSDGPRQGVLGLLARIISNLPLLIDASDFRFEYPAIRTCHIYLSK